MRWFRDPCPNRERSRTLAPMGTVDTGGTVNAILSSDQITTVWWMLLVTLGTLFYRAVGGPNLRDVVRLVVWLYRGRPEHVPLAKVIARQTSAQMVEFGKALGKAMSEELAKAIKPLAASIDQSTVRLNEVVTDLATLNARLNAAERGIRTADDKATQAQHTASTGANLARSPAGPHPM